MKKHTKLVMTIMSFCLVVMLGVIGIFAVSTLNMSVGGNVTFSADGILATISKGTMANGSWMTPADADEKMKAVEVSTNKTAAQLNAELESWQGLNLAFGESGADVTITFTITNNSTKTNDYINVKTSVDNGTAVNAEASVSPSWIVIDPGATQTFVIALSVITTEINASLTDFVVDFELSQTNEKPYVVTNETELRSALNSGWQSIALGNDISVSSAITLADDSNTTLYSDNKIVSRADGYTESIFVVPESASLKLSHIIIDGKADEFVINIDAKPFIDSTSISANMPKTSAPAIVSSGTFRADNLKVINHYAASNNHAVQINGGSVLIENSEFSHNYSPLKGAAIGIGVDGLSQDGFAVKEVIFNNCVFESNVADSVGGGAIYSLSVETIKFNKCDIVNNCAMKANASSGGAILFGDSNLSYTSDLEMPQAYFDGCLFENNHSFNDGAAIHNVCTNLTFTNTDFYRNKAHNGKQAIGTVSCLSVILGETKPITAKFDGCDFVENQVNVYTVVDHMTNIKLIMSNCNVRGNLSDGGKAIYIGCSDAEITNCVFEDNSNGQYGTLDIYPININDFFATYDKYKREKSTVTLNNVSFNNGDALDISIENRKVSNEYPIVNYYDLILKGDMTAIVRVRHGNRIIVKSDAVFTGNLYVKDSAVLVFEAGAVINGNIYVDSSTSASVVIPSGVTHNGSIIVE